jgi:hypothetical protein
MWGTTEIGRQKSIDTSEVINMTKIKSSLRGADGMTKRFREASVPMSREDQSGRPILDLAIRTSGTQSIQAGVTK